MHLNRSRGKYLLPRLFWRNCIWMIYLLFNVEYHLIQFYNHRLIIFDLVSHFENHKNLRFFWIIQIKELVKDDLESRYWFTYRKGFAQIGGNGPSSDQGWGCMLRAGQMMLAETISQIKLSRDYKWKLDSENETYQEIISLFLDTHSSPVSIQQVIFPPTQNHQFPRYPR